VLEGHLKTIRHKGDEDVRFLRQRDLRALARYLTSSPQGLLVIEKIRTDRSALEDVVEVTLQALE
jgi:hypothetical protein